MEEEAMKPPEVSSKWARVGDDASVSIMIKPLKDSFKLKLLIMSNPGSWFEFEAKNERLKIKKDDIPIS
ncbi:hypothetical protein ACOSQ3_003463 [Xanthoceras sorbifolium]